ncbi:MAG: RNA polymerase sigma-70 factor [Gemmatimonadetes bacterium]|nr:RNA polymerase sigma-70 factor [Gemmatimonadota bacterium]
MSGHVQERVEGIPLDRHKVDALLFERVVNGDSAAVNTLLQEYWSPVVVYVAELIEDREAAKDVAQDTFLYVFQRAEALTPSGSIRALLYRIARHRALNYARHRRVRIEKQWFLRSAEERRGGHPTPIQALEHAELAAAIEEAIDALPPRRKEIFSLAYLHGLSHREIAETMGITLRTVKNQMSSALAELRRSLKPFLS